MKLATFAVAVAGLNFITFMVFLAVMISLPSIPIHQVLAATGAFLNALLCGVLWIHRRELPEHW